MKTALSEYLEYLEGIKERDNIPVHIITTAKNYLEAEKQQFVDAFNQGFREGESETMTASKEDISKFDDAINYYNETFKND